MSNISSDLCVKIGNEIISNSNEVKLLGTTVDNALNFDSYFKAFVEKVIKTSMLLPDFPTIWTKINLRLIIKVFITSHFRYCPLVWMFHSKIHENSLELQLLGL